MGNVKWHFGNVDKRDKEELIGQRGMVLWLTGLSGSGKSTLSTAIEEKLHSMGRLCFRLDGDNVRHGLCSDLVFSKEDRRENIRRVSEVAKLFSEAGLITICSFISPYGEMRDMAKKIIGKDAFYEIYVKTDLETCKERDPKGLYKKAMEGGIKDFTGIDSPYEEPLSPFLEVDTSNATVEECVNRIIEALIGELLYSERMIEITKSVAREAGYKILEVYDRDFDVDYKDDKSPLTEADRVSNDLIVKTLKDAFPNIAMLSEEEKDDGKRLKKDLCWIVDPLDGTKEFVKKNGEFTVNIALSFKGKTILGVIYAPVQDEMYWAFKGKGAYMNENEKIYVSSKTRDLVLVGSRSHQSEKLVALMDDNKDKIKELVAYGSSLKGCMIAKGNADAYFRFGLTMEWDTAAMQCIVEEAGGIFRQMDDSEMTYNRENNLNDKGFYIINREENRLRFRQA